jgi:hypothetical protein
MLPCQCFHSCQLNSSYLEFKKDGIIILNFFPYSYLIIIVIYLQLNVGLYRYSLGRAFDLKTHSNGMDNKDADA